MRILEREIAFSSQGTTCRGLFVRPDVDVDVPLIVLAHGLGGVYEMRLDTYARRFAAAGYAALTFDYRFFGRSDGRPRHLLIRAQQQQDIEAAIAFGRTLPGVDAGRVVLWGTSLAGGHMIDVASRRDDIAATIVQAPFTDGVASARATSLASLLGTTGFAVADMISRLFGRGPVLVPLSATPRLPALMTKPDVVEGVAELMPPGARLSKRLSSLYDRFARGRIELGTQLTTSSLEEPFEEGSFVGSVVMPSGTALLNGVSANFVFEIVTWRPGKNLAKVRAPIFVCACEHDSVAPVGPTIAYAQRAPRGELKVYPYQHFEIYVGEAFEVVIRDQVAFLNRVVPSRATGQEDSRVFA